VDVYREHWLKLRRELEKRTSLCSLLRESVAVQIDAERVIAGAVFKPVRVQGRYQPDAVLGRWVLTNLFYKPCWRALIAVDLSNDKNLRASRSSPVLSRDRSAALGLTDLIHCVWGVPCHVAVAELLDG
jgi:hypothetical protein